MPTFPQARELNGPGYYDLPEGAEIDDRSITKEAACFFKKDGSKEGRPILLGRRFSKVFPGVDDWYRTIYDDADMEDLPLGEVRHIVLPAS